MPDLTFTQALVWCGVIAGALTTAGFILDRFAGRRTTEALSSIRANQVTLNQILERLERHGGEQGAR